MTGSAGNPDIFICYSHNDSAHIDYVCGHLGVGAPKGQSSIWSDREIEAGAPWKEAIERALSTSAVFVLLISHDSLTSEFILRKELVEILKHRDSRGARIYPILLRDCAWRTVPWLADLNVIPTRNGMPTPLLSLKRAQRDEAMKEIAEKVRAYLATISAEPKERIVSRGRAAIPVKPAENSIPIAQIDYPANSEHPELLGVVVVYYDITTHQAARSRPAFEPRHIKFIHQEIRQRLRAAAPAALGMGRGRGGQYVIEKQKPDGATALFGDCAARIVDDFQGMLRRAGVRGREAWDIRFVVTWGEAHRVPSGDDGPLPVDYVGKELDRAMQRLVMIRGGEVSVLNVHNEDTKPDPNKFIEIQGFGTTEDDAEDSAVTDWHYQRPWAPAPNEVIRIFKTTIDKLGEPLLAGSKAEEIYYHTLPETYGKIREILLQRRIVFLVGEPGIGKSLCALHLVAELSQEDDRLPILPRVAESAWEHLNRPPTGGDKEVIMLDDAFGKSFVRREHYLKIAKRQLRIFLGLAQERPDESHQFRDHTPLGKPPLVIVTVRPDIWAEVKTLWKSNDSQSDRELEQLIEDKHIVVFTGDSYHGKLDRLFRDLYGRADRSNTRERERLIADISELIRKQFRHPMNVMDFFAASDQHSFNREWISENWHRYNTAPKERYLSELRRAAPIQQVNGREIRLESTDPEYSDFAYLFFVHAFANAFLDRGQLIQMFAKITAAIDLRRPRTNAETAWNRHAERNERWGTWSEQGHFVFSHPLREEVLWTFFASEQAASSVELLLSGFLALSSEDGFRDLALRAGAFATAQIGGDLGQKRKEIVDLVLASSMTQSDSKGAAVLLANAIGQALCVGRDHPKARLLKPRLRSYLIDALARLLPRGGNAGAAAASAFCDSFRSSDKLNEFGGSSDDDFVQLVCTAARDGEPIVREQIAWAIVSNFARLPSDLQMVLFNLASDKDDWVRLRSLEAIADYYKSLVDYYDSLPPTEPTELHIRKLNDALGRGATDHSPIVARGIAGALEENYNEIKNKDGENKATEWLLEMADREELGVLEWVIWTIGSCLKDVLEADPKQTIKSDTIKKLTRLALHDDSRVRVWVARELADKYSDLKELAGRDDVKKYVEHVSNLLARLADDPNEQVWRAASDVYFGHSREE